MVVKDRKCLINCAYGLLSHALKYSMATINYMMYALDNALPTVVGKDFSPACWAECGVRVAKKYLAAVAAKENASTSICSRTVAWTSVYAGGACA